MSSPPVPNMKEKIATALAFISEGDSVRAACEKARIARPTFHLHVDPDQYARARDMQADAQFHEIDDIARQVLDGGLDPQAARVAIDAWKWTLARKKPRSYGDATKIELTGANGGPVQTLDIASMTDAQLQEILSKGRTKEE